MWFSFSAWTRHLAVNRGKHQASSDSGAVRSARVPNLKTLWPRVAFWHRQGCYGPASSCGASAHGSGSAINVCCRLRASGAFALVWMWCGVAPLRRHLAVNRGKHPASSDSGAIRSARVPNLKMPPRRVAFWHRAGAARLTLTAHASDGRSGSAINVCCRLRASGAFELVWMWCGIAPLRRHLAVNRGKHRASSDSGVIRSGRVPNLKTERRRVAFWHSAGAAPLTLTAHASGGGFRPDVNVCRRLRARGASPLVWMWCCVCQTSRHLAVNRGKHQASADSDALRSVRVPNLTTTSCVAAVRDSVPAGVSSVQSERDQASPGDARQPMHAK